MKIMKRSGIEADFDVTKISAAIKKANCEVAAVDQLSEALPSIDCCGETSAAAAICGDDAIAGIAAYYC